MGSICVRLNGDGGPDDRATPTFVVSGAARSGTSMVAAALDAAGVWLGLGLDGACFEDLDLAHAAERPLPFLRRPAAALRAPRSWRAAARGLDTAAIAAKISYRDTRFPVWGFKRPNIVQRLGKDGLALFRDPRVILCLRDPIALAQRSVIADGVSLEVALKSAHRQVDQAMRIARALECPTLLVSFEKAKADITGFLAELFDFCGLAIEPDRHAPILEAMRTAGERYNRLASAPTIGYVDRRSGWDLSGWCAQPGSKGPDAIDVLADGIKLVTTFADSFRPDLVTTGFKSAYRGFQIDLRRFELKGSEVIEVVLSGSSSVLHQGRYQLGEI